MSILNLFAYSTVYTLGVVTAWYHYKNASINILFHIFGNYINTFMLSTTQE